MLHRMLAQPRTNVPFGKSGGLGGFMTYVVLSPNRRIGIFVAVNRINFDMFDGLQHGVRELVAELSSGQ